MELAIVAIVLCALIFIAGYFLGRGKYERCHEDLENIRDILFEEEGNSYADRN